MKENAKDACNNLTLKRNKRKSLEDRIHVIQVNNYMQAVIHTIITINKCVTKDSTPTK